MRIKNLKIKYKDLEIFNDISLNFKENKFNIILGKNGCGKSSLVKSVMQLIPYKGKVEIEDQDLKLLKQKERGKLIAYMPQHIDFDENLIVHDLFEFARHPHSNGLSMISKNDKRIIKKWAKQFNLEHWMNKKFSNLSGGQKQRVLFTAALIQETKYIILDEPNNNLDIKYNLELLENLAKLKNKTIILITHDINMAIKYAENLIIINKGKISYEGPSNKITNKKIANVFKVNVKNKKQLTFEI